MYGSHVAILKEIGTVEGHTLKLTRSVQHSHGRTAAGRGTIKTKVSYEVYVMFNDMRDELVQTLHYGTKSDCTKIFNIVKKHGLETYLKMVSDCAELVEAMNRDVSNA